MDFYTLTGFPFQVFRSGNEHVPSVVQNTKAQQAQHYQYYKTADIMYHCFIICNQNFDMQIQKQKLLV